MHQSVPLAYTRIYMTDEKSFSCIHAGNVFITTEYLLLTFPLTQWLSCDAFQLRCAALLTRHDRFKMQVRLDVLFIQCVKILFFIFRSFLKNVGGDF